MQHEILDRDLNKSTKLNQLGKWIAILILWLGMMYYYSKGFSLENKIIAGTILLAIATLATYYKPYYGISFTFGITILGALNLVHFFHQQFLIGIGFSSFSIFLDLILFVVAAIQCITNRKSINEFFTKLLEREEQPGEYRAIERAKINRFKTRFAGRSIQDLEKITINQDLLPEARKAAMELINEKNE